MFSGCLPFPYPFLLPLPFTHVFFSLYLLFPFSSIFLLLLLGVIFLHPGGGGEGRVFYSSLGQLCFDNKLTQTKKFGTLSLFGNEMQFRILMA